MTHVRPLLTALAAAAVAAVTPIAVATPAVAAGPTHSVETLDFTIEQPWLSEECGFPVRLHVWGSWNVVAWTDPEGAVTKEIRNFRFRSTTSANGISLDGLTMGPETWSYAEDGTATGGVRGVALRRMPGAGTVLLFAGYELKVVDGETEVVLASHGRAEDAAALCEALTP